MNKFIFIVFFMFWSVDTIMPLLWLCFMYYLVFVPSRAFRMIHKMSRSDAEFETETLRPVFEFSFFTRTWSWAEIVTQCCYTNFLCVPNFTEFLELQKYGYSTDYYRLFCLRKILFLLDCVLVLMNIWVILKGMSHGKVKIQ